METIPSETIDWGAFGLFLVAVVVALLIAGTLIRVIRRLTGWNETLVSGLAALVVGIPLAVLTLRIFL